MAKDGTNRGGARPGLVQRKNHLLKNIEGKVKNEAPPYYKNQLFLKGDVPPIKDYLKASQKSVRTYALKIYSRDLDLAKERGCEKLVSTQLIEQYAMSVSRWVNAKNVFLIMAFLQNTQQQVMQ